MNLNDNCRIICRKTKMCPLNITFLHKVFVLNCNKEFEKLVFNKKSNKKNDQNILFSSNLSKR